MVSCAINLPQRAKGDSAGGCLTLAPPCGMAQWHWRAQHSTVQELRLCATPLNLSSPEQSPEGNFSLV